VVDDGPTVPRMRADHLGRRGFDVATAAVGAETAWPLAEHTVHLALLDLMLPDEDGLKLIRGLRSRSEVPTIVRTGHRREEVDRVVGLEVGADGLLTKPSGLRGLRPRAVLRRGGGRVRPSRRKSRSARANAFSGGPLPRRTL
jgi:two-component system, OmpR family, response regulator